MKERMMDKGTYGFHLITATGRAHCKLCGGTIEKGEPAIKYKSGSAGPNFQLHFDTETCRYIDPHIEKRLELISNGWNFSE